MEGRIAELLTDAEKGMTDRRRLVRGLGLSALYDLVSWVEEKRGWPMEERNEQADEAHDQLGPREGSHLEDCADHRLPAADRSWENNGRLSDLDGPRQEPAW